jgi:hypothetical protein
VTVIVDDAEPSAKIGVGEAATVDLAALTGPTVKSTVAVWVTVTLSSVSVAVKTDEPGVKEVTANVTTPKLSETPEAAAIVSSAPRLEASVTVLPETALPPAAFKVTVIVEVAVPSAKIEVGEAATVDWAALTAPAEKSTVAVWVTITLSSVSVAVKTGVPAVVEVTVKVTTPKTLESPEAAEIVSVAPRLEASVTVLPDMGLLLASSKVTVIVEVVMPSHAMVRGLATTVEVSASAVAAGVYSRSEMALGATPAQLIV